ncbi:hypothetical protein DFH07DRAFT_961932 [Mycena maculata]|uniref:Uncharacterized protein n=1 Tax=Mycena maculata TaxID=230809 RepID=A0AAD7IUP4_9AGAR|nr:hypothetical protein DFH07DRAFT_961932 [Mycena maculata]
MSTFQFVSENEKFGSPAPSVPSVAPPPAAAPAATPPTKYRKNFRWGEYIPAEQNPTLNARSTAAEVSISHLKITKEQPDESDSGSGVVDTSPVAGAAFSMPPIVDHIYSLDDPTQLQASAVLESSLVTAGLSSGVAIPMAQRGIPAPARYFIYVLAGMIIISGIPSMIARSMTKLLEVGRDTLGHPSRHVSRMPSSQCVEIKFCAFAVISITTRAAKRPTSVVSPPFLSIHPYMLSHLLNYGTAQL